MHGDDDNLKMIRCAWVKASPKLNFFSFSQFWFVPHQIDHHIKSAIWHSSTLFCHPHHLLQKKNIIRWRGATSPSQTSSPLLTLPTAILASQGLIFVSYKLDRHFLLHLLCHYRHWSHWHHHCIDFHHYRLYLPTWKAPDWYQAVVITINYKIINRKSYPHIHLYQFLSASPIRCDMEL